MFITRGVALAAIGLAVGLAAAAGLMRLLAALLFGVSPFDPITYGLVVVGLAAVAFVATWLPARQATRIDPMIALRSE
jgi:ABC-type antimicrobial peptide transport system permease subunit